MTSSRSFRRRRSPARGRLPIHRAIRQRKVRTRALALRALA